jgi:type IV secretory pathway VirB2 component (pilin)
MTRHHAATRPRRHITPHRRQPPPQATALQKETAMTNPPPDPAAAGTPRSRRNLRARPWGAWLAAAATAVTTAALATGPAHAGTGGSDLPWNHPLQVVVDNLTGPTAKTIAALAFVLGGAMWAFTSHEQGAKRFGQALFGVAIVLGAVNLVDALGFQGALL